MTNPGSRKKIGSLRSLLLLWLIGSAVLLILLYTGSLTYYFRFGVNLITKADLEHIANQYDLAYIKDPKTPLPTGIGLSAYLGLQQMPSPLLQAFPQNSHKHREIQIIGYDDDDEYDWDNNIVPPGLMESQCGGHYCSILFFYSYQLQNGQWLYLTQGLVANDDIVREKDLSDYLLAYLSLAILLLFTLMAFMLIRRIGQPVQALSHWADKLNLKQLDNKLPDFQYQELNSVAQHLKRAFERMALSVEKEQKFLQHASHELRTPIAVASGNLELLQVATQQRQTSEMEQNALSRLNYAVKDMQQLTETLLWLNRNEQRMPAPETFQLKPMLQKLLQDHHYLLQDKQVEVQLTGDNIQLVSQETLCSIMLANLIRNAFQYTRNGKIMIVLDKNSVTILNQEQTTFTEQPPVDKDYGFGLGLELVQQICQRLGWIYTCQTDDKGRHCSIFIK